MTDAALAWGSLLIETAGALVIGWYGLRALAALASRAPIEAARLLMIEGVVTGLSLKLAATLLKTTELGGWDAIGRFAAVFALRTLIKQLFVWERGRLSARTQEVANT